MNSNSCQVPLDKLGYFNQAQLKLELSSDSGRKKIVYQLQNIIQNKFAKE